MRGTMRATRLIKAFTTYVHDPENDRLISLCECVELINLLIETDELPSLTIIPIYLNQLSMAYHTWEDESFHIREIKGTLTETMLLEEKG